MEREPYKEKSSIEIEAEEAGMTVEQYRKFLKLKQENDALQEEDRKRRQAAEKAALDHVTSILRQRRFYKRRLFVSIAVCALLLFLLYKAKSETYISENLSSATLPVKVSLSCKLTKYAGLGQDIVIRYYYNGKQIKSGDTIKVGKKFRVQAEIVEVDPSTNDYGDGELSISLPPFDSEKSTYITVNEAGGGGHSGYATWRFTCSAKPNLNFFKVMFS